MSSASLNQQSVSSDLAYDFPSLQLARTGRLVRMIGRITFAFLFLSLIAMFLVPWRQTARGTGTVTALDPQQRPQPLKSPAEGVVSYVKPGLREGSRVTEGELLMKLTPFAEAGVRLIDQQIERVSGQVETAKLNVDLATQAIGMQQLSGQSMTSSLNESLEATQNKLEQTQNEVQALTADLDNKSNKLRIAKRIETKGLVSQQALYESEQAVVAAEAKLNKAKNAVEETERTLQAKRAERDAKLQEIEIKNQQFATKLNEAKQKLDSYSKELYALQNKRGEKFDRLEIRAPRSGVIQQWYGLEGSDAVKKNDQLFVIVPETTDLAVEMKVTGNDMPLIKEGDTVRLQFEGWPAVQFVGWPSVAVGTFGGRVNRVFPTDDGKGNFRVLVSPQKTTESDSEWPDDRYLRQGVRANGWVLLNEVPLGYEIWRQLNGFPPTVAEDEPDKGKKKGGKVKLPKA
jgi:multidrug efflux pump subunit AcrA (membrane-fusion protein)